MHWHEIRGHVLATTHERLEDVGIADFIDIVYSYSINSPQMRNEFRTAMMAYIHDYKVDEPEGAEDMSFEGFTKSATSMLDELDAFQL